MMKVLKSMAISALAASIISGCSSITGEKTEKQARNIFFSRPAKSDEKIPATYRKTFDLNNKTYEITILDYKNYKKDELTITETIHETDKETCITIRDLERFGSPDYGINEVYNKEGTINTPSTNKLFYDLKEIGTAGEEYKTEYEQLYKSMLEEIVTFNEKSR